MAHSVVSRACLIVTTTHSPLIQNFNVICTCHLRLTSPPSSTQTDTNVNVYSKSHNRRNLFDNASIHYTRYLQYLIRNTHSLRIPLANRTKQSHTFPIYPLLRVSRQTNSQAHAFPVQHSTRARRHTCFPLTLHRTQITSQKKSHCCTLKDNTIVQEKPRVRNNEKIIRHS